MSLTASGFILHRKPFRDDSYIANIYTVELGLISAVVHKPKSKKTKALAQLEPFHLYQFSYYGKGDLKTIRSFEQLENHMPPMGPALYSGLYVNELLLRSEKQEQADLELFAAYRWILSALQERDNLASKLRKFEQILLKLHGRPIDWMNDVDGGAISDSGFYIYANESGFICCDENRSGAISGETIKHVGEGRDTQQTRKLLYSVCRLALIPIIGNQAFEARKLFKK